MNLISILVGVVALVGALVGFISLLGWLNWFVIPLAVVGLVLGLMARETAGQSAVDPVVLVVAIVRLSIGGGIF